VGYAGLSKFSETYEMARGTVPPHKTFAPNPSAVKVWPF